MSVRRFIFKNAPARSQELMRLRSFLVVTRTATRKNFTRHNATRLHCRGSTVTPLFESEPKQTQHSTAATDSATGHGSLQTCSKPLQRWVCYTIWRTSLSTSTNTAGSSSHRWVQVVDSKVHTCTLLTCCAKSVNAVRNSLLQSSPWV